MKDDGYRTLTREQKLRNRILDQYASLRQFALAADIPYSSVLTLLSRGIGGASFDTVLRICRVLEIDPLDLGET
ncbi:MAG: helix-turn-helix domain-containing protein [Clostridia bacterium]|nr:helix-turn-helix domain-containing protein [Clostridia bacterium]